MDGTKLALPGRDATRRKGCSLSRTARVHCPGALTHIVSRFCSGSYRMCSDAERDAYLQRVAVAVAATDWRVIAYALMGSHVHLAAIAGQQSLADFVKPIHVGYARWLNERQRSYGPVFASRPRATVVSPREARELIAFLHSHPVRFGLARDAAESTRTSHRAYMAVEPAPPWLDVVPGLALCGFATSPRGRAAFDRYVRSCWRQARPPGQVPVVGPVGARPSRWQGSAQRVLAKAARERGVEVAQLRSSERTRRVVEARRLAVHAGVRLGFSLTEMASAVNIAVSSASRLVRGRPADAAVERVARACRAGTESERS